MQKYGKIRHETIFDILKNSYRINFAFHPANAPACTLRSGGDITARRNFPPALYGLAVARLQISCSNAITKL